MINSGIDQGQFVGQLSLFLHHLGCFFFVFFGLNEQMFFFMFIFSMVLFGLHPLNQWVHTSLSSCV